MKAIVLIAVLLTQMLSAKVLKATYEVSFGIFNTMGIANARMEVHDDQTYDIRIEARTVGIAKALSNNRVEVYESHGIVQNGRLVPQQYSKVRRTDSKKITKIYTFDHANKIVWRETIEKGERNREKNDYYATEDILSLFFNFKYYLDGKQNRSIAAIGGNKIDGRIDIVFPNARELGTMKRQLEMENGEFLKVILNDRIFASEKGELLINLGQDGLCDKAILEDVLLFGDILGVRVQ